MSFAPRAVCLLFVIGAVLSRCEADAYIQPPCDDDDGSSYKIEVPESRPNLIQVYPVSLSYGPPSLPPPPPPSHEGDCKDTLFLPVKFSSPPKQMIHDRPPVYAPQFQLPILPYPLSQQFGSQGPQHGPAYLPSPPALPPPPQHHNVQHLFGFGRPSLSAHSPVPIHFQPQQSVAHHPPPLSHPVFGYGRHLSLSLPPPQHHHQHSPPIFVSHPSLDCFPSSHSHQPSILSSPLPQLPLFPQSHIPPLPPPPPPAKPHVVCGPPPPPPQSQIVFSPPPPPSFHIPSHSSFPFQAYFSPNNHSPHSQQSPHSHQSSSPSSKCSEKPIVVPVYKALLKEHKSDPCKIHPNVSECDCKK